MCFKKKKKDVFQILFLLMSLIYVLSYQLITWVKNYFHYLNIIFSPVC